MHGEINSTINVLPPFKYFCQTIGNLPTSYLESMTYYETLVWLCNYLKETVIPTVNNTGNAVTELQGLYLQLQDYVNTYFDNLDYISVINQKLDSMAEDGTITSLIEQYMTPFITNMDNRIDAIDTKVNRSIGNNPIPVTSVDSMTDTSRIYVNTTDGNWYYYDDTNWVIGGAYQSIELANKSVSFNKIANATYNLLNTKYKEVDFVGTGLTLGMGFSVQNDRITSVNNAGRCRFTLTIPSGILITFNNPNNLYKYGVYSAPRNTYEPIIDRIGLANYSADYNELYLPSDNYDGVVSYRVTMGFADDRNVTEDNVNELINAMKIYQIETNLTGRNIIDKTLGINDNFDINTSDDNIPYTIYNYSLSSNSELRKDSTAFSILFPIKDNTNYYVKVAGSYNHSKIALLYDTPDELFKNWEELENFVNVSRNVTGWAINTSDNQTSGNITFNSRQNNYKYAFIYLYNGNNPNINIQVSKNAMPSYVEPSNIIYPEIETNNLYYTKIPNILSSTTFYNEGEYADTQEMQGITTDGTYLYYCMHGNTDDDTSCIGKINISSGEVVLKKNNTSYRHANGLCYYPKNNTLYVASLMNFDSEYPDFYILNANTLEQIGTLDLPDLSSQWENFAYCHSNGCAAIAYSSELKRFIVLLRPSVRNGDDNQIYGLAIYTENWSLDKLIKIENPDNHQYRGGMWANKDYIYIVSTLSSPNKDVITILDYNGNIVDLRVLTEFNRHTIEGIVVDYENNIIYTSHANDTIYKLDIKSYKNISMNEIYKKYNMN